MKLKRQEGAGSLRAFVYYKRSGFICFKGIQARVTRSDLHFKRVTKGGGERTDWKAAGTDTKRLVEERSAVIWLRG